MLTDEQIKDVKYALKNCIDTGNQKMDLRIHRGASIILKLVESQIPRPQEKPADLSWYDLKNMAKKKNSVLSLLFHGYKYAAKEIATDFEVLMETVIFPVLSILMLSSLVALNVPQHLLSFLVIVLIGLGMYSIISLPVSYFKGIEYFAIEYRRNLS